MVFHNYKVFYDLDYATDLSSVRFKNDEILLGILEGFVAQDPNACVLRSGKPVVLRLPLLESWRLVSTSSDRYRGDYVKISSRLFGPQH